MTSDLAAQKPNPPRRPGRCCRLPRHRPERRSTSPSTPTPKQQRQSKKQRPKGIPLLNTAPGLHCMFPEAKVGPNPVAPVCPQGNFRWARASCPEHGIERIPKVNFDQDLVDMANAVLKPLSACVNCSFGANRHADPNLRRPKVVPSLLTHTSAEEFAHEPSQDLPDCNGSHASLRLRQRMQRSTGQVWGQRSRRIGVSPRASR